MKIFKKVIELFIFKKKRKKERLSNEIDLVKLMQRANLSEVNGAYKF